MQLLISVFSAALLMQVFINGFYLLISPKAWSRLPKWLRFRGPKAEDNRSEGHSEFRMRLAGVLLVIAAAASIVLCRLI